jgi:Rhodopirellula transposase DDE domain
VARLLKASGYSLQANSKTIEGTQHPDRDAQFGYLNARATEFRAAGDPVIGVDTKKKELVGNYKAAGREWGARGGTPAGEGARLRRSGPGQGRPYGVYDITANTGWVDVGTDADTAAFAVESIRRWWTTLGADIYPGARRLLITADSGGSNGSRLRLWKTELATFAGLDITVCHLPPGTSKWNKIEHRLFSAISRNWRGRPLESHEIVIETLRATTTSTGLTVHAELDTGTYERGIKITDKQIAALESTQLHRHAFHGDWNYTLTADRTATCPKEPT